MSLVLLAVHDRHAAVLSDGALTFFERDGTARRDRDDYQKFRAVGKGFVVAATGVSWMIEQMWDDVEDFVRSEGVTFDAVSTYLSGTLPSRHCATVEQLRADGSEGRDPSSAVALIGFDNTRDAARLVTFGPTGYEATEQSWAVLGAVADTDRLLETALRGADTPAAMPLAMVAVLAQLSQGHAEIGGQTFVATVKPPLAGAVTSGSTISGSTSTPTVQAPAAKATTIADFGITDAYTKAQIDTMLSKYLALAGAQGSGAQLAIGGVTYTSVGTFQAIFTGAGAQGIYLVPILTMAVLEIFGWDQTSHADSFVDLVAVSTMPGGNIVSVVSTKDLQGTPRARAYTFATGNVCIALAGAPGDTYNVSAGLRIAKVQ